MLKLFLAALAIFPRPQSGGVDNIENENDAKNSILLKHLIL